MVNEISILTKTEYKSNVDINMSLDLLGHWKMNDNYTDSSSFSKDGSAGFNDSNLQIHYKLNGDATDSEGANDATESFNKKLIHHYKFNNDVIDSGSAGNDGTWNGTEQYETGKINNATKFETDSLHTTKVGGIVEISIVTLQEGKSISWWQKVDSFSSGHIDDQSYRNNYNGTIVLSTDTFDSNISLRSDKIVIQDEDGLGGTGKSYEGITTVNTGTWYHFAIVFKGDATYFYKNGVEIDTDDALGANLLKFDQIGRGYAGMYTDGLIDDFRVYDRELTIGEIKEIYNSDDGTENVNYFDGKINQGFLSGGDDSDQVNMPDAAGAFLDDTDDFTISYWLKRGEEGAVPYKSIFNFRSDHSGEINSVRMQSNSSGTYAYVRVDTSLESNTTFGVATISDDAWHHIALVYTTSSKEFRLYYDGSSIATKVVTGTIDLTNDLTNITIGGGFIGLIDDFRIYDDDLRAKNILDIYNEGNGYENDPPTFSTGKINNAADFDGLGKYVQILTFSMPTNTETSFVAWIKPASDITSTNTIFSDSSQIQGTSVGYFWVYIGNSGGIDILMNYADQVAGNYGKTETWAGVITKGSWNHIVLNVDWTNKTAELFVNNVSQGSKNLHADTLPPESDGKTIYIGAYGTSHWHKFRGAIDDVRIYSRVLTLSEISAIYNDNAGTETIVDRPTLSLNTVISQDERTSIISNKDNISVCTKDEYTSEIA